MEEDYRLAHELDRVLRQIDAKMNRQMARSDTLGVGQMGCLALTHLSEAQPCSAQELATRMGRDTSQIGRILKHLDAKGTITRVPSTEDKRATVLGLTAVGEGFVEELKGVMSGVVDDVCASLTQKERARLTALLGQI